MGIIGENKLKYVVLLCDGMSDLPCEQLGGRTPMEAAVKPNMDRLASRAETGLAKTVPDGMKPGSDVANLSVLGYNPAEYYTGRSPLEAASIGVDMKPSDVSLRCNLVTLSGEPDFRDKTMLDYCAGDISTAEARTLIAFVQEKLGDDRFRFYGGVSYRHCLIWSGGTLDVGELTPPHDITGKPIAGSLNVNANGAELLNLTEKALPLLENHPVNVRRVKEGKSSANSIWLWGEGKRAELAPFYGKYGKKAALISAVDLLKGIGKLSGMDVIEVEGATGYIDTNFGGKAQAALNALKGGADLAYIHIEAPDECGHRGEADKKVKSIELIDELVLKPVLDAFAGERIRILITPDHPTPLVLRTHTSAPVPYLIYDSGENKQGVETYTEKTAAESGILIEKGHELMERFING